MTKAAIRPLRLRARPAEFLGERRGGVLIELAFAFPVVVLLVIGCFDMARMLLLNQKLDRAATITADLATRPQSITQTDVNNILAVVTDILAPFEMGANGVVIVSSVSKAAGENAKVDWQRTGGGTLSVSSHIGVPGGGVPTMPGGFVVDDGENVIVTEVFYDYAPVFLDKLGYFGVSTAAQLSHVTIRRPRRGDLSTLGT